MKLGFDAKRLYHNFTGLGNYSRSLLKNLQVQFPSHEYHLYSPSPSSNPETRYYQDHSGFKTIVSDSTFKAYWRSFSIRKQLEADQIELYHGLSNELPFSLKNSSIKSVVTIHDLIFKVLPHTYPIIDRSIYDWKVRKSCQIADRIVAISEHTKQDIVSNYGTNPDKIEVIYQACNPIFYQAQDVDQTEPIRKKWNLPAEFFLYVGSIEPRKNLKSVLQAYRSLDSKYRIPLVVVGRFKSKAYQSELLQIIESNNLKDSIIWINHLTDNLELKQLYHLSKALIYPSFYEGFGLPIVEALLCKTPVITSNVSSLPEAAGPDSLCVDPNQPEAIAKAMITILEDSNKRDQMIKAGYEYANRKFDPKVLSQQLMRCYEDVLLNESDITPPE